LKEGQWLQIYRETVHPLYGYVARRTGGNRELAEDIVQESFLRALENWSRRGIPEIPLAWLRRVARNILVDYLRRKGRFTSIDMANSPDTPDPSQGDQFRSLELFMTISSLGRKKAAILEAHYFDGLRVGEIAKEMAVTERAVEGQLRRARQSLKLKLPDLKPKGEKNE
jgi:RNA polymerase sigma-70 factor (ECF subfamily)